MHIRVELKRTASVVVNHNLAEHCVVFQLRLPDSRAVICNDYKLG